MFYSAESVGKQRQTRSLGVCRCENTELWMISQRNVLTCEGRKEEPNLTLTTDLFIDHSDHQNCDTWRSQQENLRPYEHSWKHTSHDLSPALNRKLMYPQKILWRRRWNVTESSQNLLGFHHSPSEYNVNLSTYKLKYLHETISSHVPRVHVSRWCYKHW